MSLDCINLFEVNFFFQQVWFRFVDKSACQRWLKVMVYSDFNQTIPRWLLTSVLVLTYTVEQQQFHPIYAKGLIYFILFSLFEKKVGSLFSLLHKLLISTQDFQTEQSELIQYKANGNDKISILKGILQQCHKEHNIYFD